MLKSCLLTNESTVPTVIDADSVAIAPLRSDDLKTIIAHPRLAFTTASDLLAIAVREDVSRCDETRSVEAASRLTFRPYYQLTIHEV